MIPFADPKKKKKSLKTENREEKISFLVAKHAGFNHTDLKEKHQELHYDFHELNTVLFPRNVRTSLLRVWLNTTRAVN